MDFNFSEQEEVFRAEVRAFIEANNPPGSGWDRRPEDITAWNEKLAEKRWIGFSWPSEEGGGGGSLIEQFILKEEMSKAHAPALGSDFMGLAWVGPALTRHGTQAQKDRFLPDLLKGRSRWCTGYSEPDIGSDLAGLQTRAVLEADEYIVNGQKIWTTAAHTAKWIFMMVRTELDKSVSKYRGITCLLVPMDSEGIEVRPIKNMSTGGMAHMLNEVFFTDVRVPVELRLGAEGQGWEILCSALQSERSGITEVNRHSTALEDLIGLAKRSRRNGRPALLDGQVRRKLGSFEARIEAMRLGGLRALTNQLRGDLHPSQASINKLHNCDLLVEMSELALQLLGTAAPYLGGSEVAIDSGRWSIGALSWPATVVGGGTPNIQKNIIAERFLGLPKD